VGQAARVLAEDQLGRPAQLAVRLLKQHVADARQQVLPEDEGLRASVDEHTQAGQAERVHVGHRVDDRVELLDREPVERGGPGGPGGPGRTLGEPALAQVGDVEAVLGVQQLEADIGVHAQQLIDVVALRLVAGAAQLGELGGVVDKVRRGADDRSRAPGRPGAQQGVDEVLVHAADLPVGPPLVVAVHPFDALRQRVGGELGGPERRQRHRQRAVAEREQAQAVADRRVEVPLARLPRDVVGEAVVRERDRHGFEAAAK